MPKVYQRAAARSDLVEQFVYLAENAGLAVANRFMAQAEETFAELAHEPLIGAPLQLTHPRLEKLRKWRIKGFDNHLVFYEPHPDGVSIVRVLHAARDWWGLLGVEG